MSHRKIKYRHTTHLTVAYKGWPVNVRRNDEEQSILLRGRERTGATCAWALPEGVGGLGGNYWDGVGGCCLSHLPSI
jgi:hypothetical protein